MSRDIDGALEDWEYKPGVVQARIITSDKGRDVIQMRLDLGVLQMEMTGRPDGDRPFSHATFFDYLKQEARRAQRKDKPFVLSEAQCEQSDREFIQFYHRRVAWMALRKFSLAVADAKHTLAFMNFVREHSPSDEFTQAHEQYRGFVLFHHTQAAAAEALERDDAEGAIDAIGDGLKQMRAFFSDFEVEEQMEDDGMVQQLRKMERSLREMHHIETTLREQLEEAVAKEDYEGAAKLRDALRRREAAM